MPQYGVELTETNMIAPMASLKVLYERIPETTGCEQCPSVNGPENTHWCCLSQNPSMHYSEFIYVWREAEKWKKSRKVDLIVRAICTYLNNDMDKGCIFYKDGCSIYSLRPLACRLYGVMPKETWDRREQRIKEILGDNVKVKPQCGLVSCKDGSSISVEQEDRWNNQVVRSEKQLGVPSNNIDLFDNPGGSYRTFHDHLLMELFPINMMAKLTQIRLTNPSKEDIEATAGVIREKLETEGVF